MMVALCSCLLVEMSMPIQDIFIWLTQKHSQALTNIHSFLILPLLVSTPFAMNPLKTNKYNSNYIHETKRAFSHIIFRLFNVILFLKTSSRNIKHSMLEIHLK